MNIFKNNFSNKNSLATRVPLATFMILGLLTSSGIFIPFTTEVRASENIKMCQATGSTENPFTLHNPNKNSTNLGQGESGINENDIVSAFESYEGNNLETVYEEFGGMTGLQILNSDCDVNVSNDDPDEPVDDLNEVTIIATKIVCPDASMLPRNTGTLNIDENTASNFLDLNTECYAKTGWEFQWSFEHYDDSPDNEGELSDWNTSNPTDSNGKTTMTISRDDLLMNKISVREVWNENYLEFAGSSLKNVDSAEFYCQTDGANLDNFDYINDAQLGETYHCVGWNVPKVATVHAHKIVCEDEEQMPKYGAGGHDVTIDQNTAINWVKDNDSCELVKDWEFEWAPEGTSNPDNPSVDALYGHAEGVWNTFGPTDEDGKATLNLTAEDINGNNHIWIREVLKDGYLPFTYGPNNKTNENDYSAEIYCHTDVRNYDNYDMVNNIEINNTYYCVAWNMEVEDNTSTNPDEGTNQNNSNGDGDNLDDSGSSNSSVMSDQTSRGSGYYVNPSNTPVNLIEEISDQETATNPQLPEGQVAGEQVSVIPTGAPDTGMGGTSKNPKTNLFSILFLTLTLSLVTLYPKINVSG